MLVSTGDGKNQERDAKTTIFKKTGLTYMLKMKTSREFFSQVRGLRIIYAGLENAKSWEYSVANPELRSYSRSFV